MSKTKSAGVAVLENPIENKGTAFSAAERRSLKLEGLLPAAIETLDTQVERAMGHLAAKPDALEQYIYAPWSRIGILVTTSGQFSRRDGELAYAGRLGVR